MVAYSERVFEIHKKVRFLGTGRCLIFEKAEIWGGVIRGGEIRGGEIWGGVIWGGVIWGGEIWGGTYEVSMLQIQGSRHFLYAYFNEENIVELGIGCERHSIAWWQENYEKIGVKEGYTKEEIAEYKAYIDLYALRYIQ